jgi:hypothetical protein
MLELELAQADLVFSLKFYLFGILFFGHVMTQIPNYHVVKMVEKIP